MLRAENVDIDSWRGVAPFSWGNNTNNPAGGASFTSRTPNSEIL